MSRIATFGRFFGVCGLLAMLMASTAAVSARAQESEDEAMDEDPAMTISCADGTTLAAMFGESDVLIGLADGTEVTLPQQDDPKGFRFSNGQLTLSGDENSISWTAGKKAPVACQAEEQQQPLFFDQPLTVDTKELPKDPANPQADPQVNCYRFEGFMVKEVDLGEKGAALAIGRPESACEQPAGKDEKPVTDEVAGYFLGVKGNLVFFQGADGENGGVPFVVYDAHSMKRLFDDSFQGNDFESLEASGDTLDIAYRRVFTADCSLFKDGGDCATRIKAATGLGTEDAPLPDCGPSYAAEIKRSPANAKAIETLPSVLTYEAQVHFDGSKLTVAPRKGETSCYVPD